MVPEPVGKLGRPRRLTRIGRNDLVRLCAQAAARLFRQRWPAMAINGGRLLELHRDWALIEAPPPYKTAGARQNQFALGQAMREFARLGGQGVRTRRSQNLYMRPRMCAAICP